MKWNYRDWTRSDLESYTMFMGGFFFTFVLTAYFVKNLGVLMTEPRIAFLVGSVFIGGMIAFSILGYIGVRRFRGYYSRSFQLGPHQLSVCVTHRLSEAGFRYDVDVKKAPWYFFMEPKHVISLDRSNLRLEVFSLNDSTSSLYLGPKSETNQEVMKEVIKILNPLSNTHIASKILSLDKKPVT